MTVDAQGTQDVQDVQDEKSPRRPFNRMNGRLSAEGVTFGWDDTWQVEYLFQVVAIYLTQRLGGQRVHALDTSKLSIPDDYNRRVAGAPDIVACVDGRYVSIELKVRNGKQTRPQEYEGERVENAHGTYVVAHTLREVFEALEIEVPEAGND